MPVHEIETVDMVEKISKVCNEVNQYLIVKSSAKWCGPCKAVAPKYKELSDFYSDKAVFVEFDVDEHQELAEYFNVEAMPTFYIIKANEVIKKVEGADISYIRSILDM